MATATIIDDTCHGSGFDRRIHFFRARHAAAVECLVELQFDERDFLVLDRSIDSTHPPNFT